MKLVFKLCKGSGGKVEAKRLSILLSGSICCKYDQASTLHHRAPPSSPHSGQVYPRAQVPAPLLSSPAQVLRAHTYLSPARSIDWTGICFGERQEGDELIVREVRPVDSVLVIRGSSSLLYSKIIPFPSKESTRSLEPHPGHRLWVIPGSFVGQDQG